MAKVQGIKEKLHMPIYDAFFVRGARNGTAAETFKDKLTDPRVIRFFVDIQNKTRLETNLQAAGVLPSMNTFEARAMRVVANVPCVSLSHENVVNAGNEYCTERPTGNTKADKESQQEAEKKLVVAIQKECDRACAATSSILPALIYNSVTTLLVGEKIMIEMPTFWFPAGAGVSPGNGAITNHGNPDPMATFRFAEPVFIEPHQNFRVEMMFPQGVPDEVKEALGPLRIWVMLDGYLTRDVS
jgi:hypothetical protein